ncbi:MAG: UvrD-helicase domain-containing protein, partial [Bacteroidales bacterium]|nr:UvrD-helicase domain-containing protein [Bacteroidales bacterium]
MIHVYKASAGAGKTFILTQEYIKLLFQNPQNFKQTLAVTFTNKASAEMKHRIITSLYELAYKTDSPYMEELKKTTQKDKDSICTTAQNILHEILHNYSFFFIETIDSFFQRVIRNFAKENNLHSSYNLELNQGEVIEKAVLQMFLELSEELPAFKIIRDFSDYKVQEGKSRNVLHEIISYSSILFNEQYMMRADSIHRVNLPDFFKKITNIQQAFETKITKLSSQFAELMSKHQLVLDDFSGKKGGFIGKLHAIQNGFDSKKELTLIQKTNIGEISKWYTKNSPSKNDIEAFAHAGGYDLAMEIVNMLESEEGKIYYTAKEILTQKYLLQIVHQVQHHIDEYLKQENLFLISNTNSLLASLINEHDAPFVYEKIGHYI